MHRPSPLKNLGTTTSVPDPYETITLTPRTPHSRSGRAEEGYSEPEMREIREEYARDYPQSSAAPLLSGRTSKEFKRLMPAVTARATIVFWCGVSGVLLFLTVVSYWYPGTLEWYLGVASITSIASHTSVDPSLLLSYENYTRFPLNSAEYLTECYRLTGGKMAIHPYWEPPHGMVMDVEHMDDSAVCSSTITYMLDGNRGLLADLALIAQAAALARERNRTFFIDDTYWNRGKWTDHFQSVRETQPGPEPGCKPPPPEEYVACPRHARHWIITSRTALFHFGHMYVEAYEDGYKRNTNRLKPLYDMAHLSLTSTIRPSAESQRLIKLARQDLPDSPYASAHIRRGDAKAQAWAHRQSYVPLEDFADNLSLFESHTKTIYLASDSPSSLAALSNTLENEQGKTVYYLGRSQHPELRALASPHSYNQTEFGEYDTETRSRLTRGMVVDFALLTGVWPTSTIDKQTVRRVLCTVGSAVCKLSAVALGWDEAFGHMSPTGDGRIDRERMRWVDVDLKGSVIPQWSAFDIF